MSYYEYFFFRTPPILSEKLLLATEFHHTSIKKSSYLVVNLVPVVTVLWYYYLESWKPNIFVCLKKYCDSFNISIMKKDLFSASTTAYDYSGAARGLWVKGGTSKVRGALWPNSSIFSVKTAILYHFLKIYGVHVHPPLRRPCDYYRN